MTPDLKELIIADLNPSPNMPILGSSTLTAKKKKIGCKKYGQIGIQLTDWVENIAGKEEIAPYNKFLFFSHNVFKSCLLLLRQNEYLWSKGLIC